MKKLIALILALGIIFGLVGCGNNNNKVNEQTKKVNEQTKKTAPEDTINSFFAEFKKCNFDNAKKYLLVDKNIDFSAYKDFTKGEKDAIKYWVEKTGYEIKSMEITNDSAEATINISTLNGQKIYSDYMKDLLNLKEKYISAKDQKDKEEYMQAYDKALIDSIRSKNNEIVTNTVNLELENKNGKWYIVGNQNFTNALYGGFDPEKFKS
ncbi:hypothetical protein [Clostridium sardiniense]|uniref:LptM family lipoprotein n=1 Tax=Clostridium sardiniense TaxID=29369 RepID=UPI003D35323D